MRIAVVLALACAGCAHLAQTEARAANERAAAANTASFDAALSAALREAGATLWPAPTQWFQPGGDCSPSLRAARDQTPLPVVLGQAAGPDVTVDCDALLAAMRAGDSVEAADGSEAGVSLVFSPLETSLLGRTRDGAFVHFKPQPQIVPRTMTVVTPGLACCCGSPEDDARQPRRFWVLPGHGLAVRAVSVPFDFERVELRCDPRAPQ